MEHFIKVAPHQGTRRADLITPQARTEQDAGRAENRDIEHSSVHRTQGKSSALTADRSDPRPPLIVARNDQGTVQASNTRIKIGSIQQAMKINQGPASSSSPRTPTRLPHLRPTMDAIKVVDSTITMIRNTIVRTTVCTSSVWLR